MELLAHEPTKQELKNIKLKDENECRNCEGTGEYPDGQICMTCEGKGYLLN